MSIVVSLPNLLVQIGFLSADLATPDVHEFLIFICALLVNVPGSIRSLDISSACCMSCTEKNC